MGKRLNIVSVAADYVINASDDIVFVDTTADDWTLTMPLVDGLNVQNGHEIVIVHSATAGNRIEMIANPGDAVAVVVDRIDYLSEWILLKLVDKAWQRISGSSNTNRFSDINTAANFSLIASGSIYREDAVSADGSGNNSYVLRVKP
jgi:hypothetical protein